MGILRGAKGSVRGWLLVALAMGMLAGCGSSIGDDCDNNQDCPSGSYCDKVMPGGYCTIIGCRPDDCPDGSVCIEFYNGERFCMASCKGDGDCRDDYSCIKEEGLSSFCSVKNK